MRQRRETSEQRCLLLLPNIVIRKYISVGIPGVCALILLLNTSLQAQQKPLTSQQVIERIQSHIGVPWRRETVDTFKAGNPGVPVTGIAVTMMATLDVLQRAVESGNNLIITHEPTFFDHLDKATDLAEGESDPVLAATKGFLEIRERSLRNAEVRARQRGELSFGVLTGIAILAFALGLACPAQACPQAWPISLLKSSHGCKSMPCV